MNVKIMDPDRKKISRLQERIESLHNKNQQMRGQLQAVQDRLEHLGYNMAEAKEAAKKLRETIEEAKAKYNERFQDFIDEWEDKLEKQD